MIPHTFSPKKGLECVDDSVWAAANQKSTCEESSKLQLKSKCRVFFKNGVVQHMSGEDRYM